jgi:hypothetical protein
MTNGVSDYEHASWQQRQAGNSSKLATATSWQQRQAGNSGKLATAGSWQQREVESIGAGMVN